MRNENYKKNLITIILPTFNCAKYLDRSIKSILNQTYDNIEIIIINDGSTDNSKEIILDYAQKDNRIKYYEQKNKGVYAARNLGLANANGDYISFIDADDYVEKNMIEKLYKCIIDTQTDIAICNYYENYNKILTYDNNTTLHYPESINYLTTICQNFGYLWNKLYKSSLFKNFRFLEEKRCVDAIAIIELLKISKSISFISDCLYHYCHRKDSLINAEKYKNITYTKKIINVWITIANDNELQQSKLAILKNIYISHFWKGIYHVQYKNNTESNEIITHILKCINEQYTKEILNSINMFNEICLINNLYYSKIKYRKKEIKKLIRKQTKNAINFKNISVCRNLLLFMMIIYPRLSCLLTWISNHKYKLG